MCTINDAWGHMFIEISMRRWQWHPTTWQLATSYTVYLVSNSKTSTLYPFNTYVRPIQYDCIFFLKSKAFALASWHHHIWPRILTQPMRCSNFQFTSPPNIRGMDTLRVICAGNDRACLMLQDWEIHVTPYAHFVDHPDGSAHLNRWCGSVTNLNAWSRKGFRKLRLHAIVWGAWFLDHYWRLYLLKRPYSRRDW